MTGWSEDCQPPISAVIASLLHATNRPSPRASSGGTSTEHEASFEGCGHRGWKGHPGGGSFGLGTSPWREQIMVNWDGMGGMRYPLVLSWCLASGPLRLHGVQRVDHLLGRLLHVDHQRAGGEERPATTIAAVRLSTLKATHPDAEVNG